MNQAAIEAIVEQYEKHGWTLRRVLLGASAKEPLNLEKFTANGILVLSSDLDAAWFSRGSQPGKETWELRSLGPPYAIDAFLDDQMSDQERDELLRNTENRMRLASPHRQNN